MYNISEEPIVNPKVSLQRDIDFINSEIITQNDDGTYTKFSNALQAVSVIGMTKEHYIDFWTKQYNKPTDSKESLDKILTVVEEKFKTGLTEKDVMINLIKSSNDYTKDKELALSLLGVKKSKLKSKVIKED